MKFLRRIKFKHIPKVKPMFCHQINLGKTCEHRQILRISRRHALRIAAPCVEDDDACQVGE